MENLEGFQNYIRLTLLLQEATRVLRQSFRDQYKKILGMEWDDGPQSGQNFIKTLGKKYYRSAQKIQKGFLKAGNVNDWDLTMLCNILTTSMTMENPSESETEVKDWKNKILELRQIRNKLAHLGDLKCVSKLEFPGFWDKLAETVISLGGSASTVEKIKSASNISGIEFKNVEGAHSRENQEKFQKMKNQGNAAVNAGEWEKAIGFYTRALDLFGISDVDRSILHSNRSHAHLKSLKQNENLKESCDKEKEKKSKDALEDARKCIDLRPNWWKGYARLGQLFHWRKEWKTAILFYNQALALSPNQEEITSARDECRYEEKKIAIKENMDPLLRPASRDEILANNQRAKGCKVKGRDLTEMYQKLMKSKNKEMRAIACVYFAHNCYHGIDAPIDIAKAAQLFAKGAEFGNAEGMYNLGLLHQKGQGIPRDFQKAIQLFEKAAGKPPRNSISGTWDIGVAAAEYALGKAHDDGVGKRVDYKEAAKWYHRASSHGISNADNNLAFLYKEGRGVKMDLNKAFQLWELSASRDNSLAMKSLAYEYLACGDVTKAKMWHQRLVDGGNIEAVLNQEKFLNNVTRVENGCQVLACRSDFPGLNRNSSLDSDLVDQVEISSMVLNANVDYSQDDEIGTESDSDTDSDSVSDSAKNCSHEHEHQLTSPNRVQIVVKFRDAMKTAMKLRGLNTFGIKATAQPIHKQKAPTKLSSLKDITLSEMDPNKDHVYSRTVMNLTIVEDPIMTLYPSVATVVRDENWDVIMCYFYNFDKEEERREKFKFGTTLSITNPYHRLTADMSHGIRVDDPKSVIFHGRDENNSSLCRFCWKEMETKDQYRCGGCKRVIYCGRKCQEQDWKLLKHKVMCDPHLLQRL